MKHLNSPMRYGYNAFAKFLHWTIAILIIVNYIMGLVLDETKWYTIHKQIGLTILLLVVLRIIWRLSSHYPRPLASIVLVEQVLAYVGHVLLYILMLLIPIFGVLLVQGHGHSLMIWGIIKLPTIILPQARSVNHLIVQWHLWLANAIIVIALGHALIALIHHFILKDRLLLRMLPFNKKSRL